MSDRIRVGVIGTSWWADFMYLPSLASHPHAEIAAICGRDRGDEMANKYAIPAVYTDYRTMLDQAALDAVVVSTPDDLHYMMTMRALDAGLHVLCEKPLALNAADARAMLAKANAESVKHMVLFTWRWMPYMKYAHELVEEGFVGRCFYCDFRFQGDYDHTGAYLWRLDGRRANGILGDLGSHEIDLARWFVGDISRVNSHLATFVPRTEANGNAFEQANDSALLTLEFANGAHGTIQASAAAHLADRSMELTMSLYGDAGTLRVEVVFGGGQAGGIVSGARVGENEFRVLPVPLSMWGDTDPAADFGAQVQGVFTTQPVGPRLFIDAIRYDYPATPDFNDGLKAQEVIDAALESHRSGCWISLR